jgi:hypothetical protein
MNDDLLGFYFMFLRNSVNKKYLISLRSIRREVN